jgi:hypothetical protein
MSQPASASAPAASGGSSIASALAACSPSFPYVPPPAFSDDSTSFFSSKKEKNEFFKKEQDKDRKGNSAYHANKATARMEAFAKCYPVITEWFSQGKFPYLSYIPVSQLFTCGALLPAQEWSPAMCDMLSGSNNILESRLQHLHDTIAEKKSFPCALSAHFSFALFTSAQAAALSQQLSTTAAFAANTQQQLTVALDSANQQFARAAQAEQIAYGLNQQLSAVTTTALAAVSLAMPMSAAAGGGGASTCWYCQNGKCTNAEH